MRTAILAILVIAALAIGGGLIATTAYQAGLAADVTVVQPATDGTVVAPLVVPGYGYGWGWHGFGPGFGFFGILGTIFVLFLLIGLIRFAFRGPRGWGGSRGWGGPGGPGGTTALIRGKPVRTRRSTTGIGRPTARPPNHRPVTRPPARPDPHPSARPVPPSAGLRCVTTMKTILVVDDEPRIAPSPATTSSTPASRLTRR